MFECVCVCVCVYSRVLCCYGFYVHFLAIAGLFDSFIFFFLFSARFYGKKSVFRRVSR